MYVLTNDCGSTAWTRHGRFPENYKEAEQDLAVYRSHETAQEAAIEVAKEETELLRVVSLEHFMTNKRKERQEQFKRGQTQNRHAQYLPFEREFTCRKSGAIAGITLYLIVDHGMVSGMVIQMDNGHVYSVVDEDYDFEFIEEYKISADSIRTPTETSSTEHMPTQQNG